MIPFPKSKDMDNPPPEKRSGGLRRTPDKARKWARSGKPLARRKRIKPMSEKRMVFEAELNRVRPIVYKRSGGLCEARLPGCIDVATNVHHIVGRTVPNANTPDLLRHCCGECHPEGIHRKHRKLAIARGLLIPWATSTPNKIAASTSSPVPQQEVDARAAAGANPPSPRPQALVPSGPERTQSDRPHSAAAAVVHGAGPDGDEVRDERGREVA